MRIGIGSDTHRLIEGRKLIIGGVIIPAGKGEDAHSDGDVLVHAIIDAILGASACDDIGSHFPPSDEKYRDASSLELLRRTMEITGARITNIDSTVELEAPRLREYILSMRKNIADAACVDISAVSVKAKTAEGMGPIGEGKAISAIASVLIE